MRTTNAEAEITSQPALWPRAAALATEVAASLPRPGERVLVAGCGTSLFMAQAYAARREAAGHGETDAVAASELRPGRSYDRAVAITRSGTTTEILDALARMPPALPRTVVTAVPDSPAAAAADAAVVLDFADEVSVVQTRFATSALALLRASLGEDLEKATGDAAAAVRAQLPGGVLDRTRFTFLGQGWTIGLANEAALKLREAALAWAESYPAMEYRHGPIALADSASVVWFFGEPPPGLAAEVAGAGGLVVTSAADPMAELIRVQRLAVGLAAARGLDPDRPQNLSRSVVLGSGGQDPG